MVIIATPSHLKYVATLPVNLLLMDCFTDTNVSQGSVAAYARCGCDASFNIYLTTNLPRNFLIKIFNRFRFDRIVIMSPWPTFLAHPERKNVARKKTLTPLMCTVGHSFIFFGVITVVIFLPARRYGSAGTSYDPVSVSVCHKSVFYRNGWTE